MTEFVEAKPGTYTCSYPYKGGHYVFEIRADSFQDADARLLAIQEFSKVDGELAGYVPADNITRQMDHLLDEAKHILD